MKAKEYAKLWNSWQEDENRPTNGEVFPDAPEEERNKPTDDLGLSTYICHKILQEYQPLIKLRKAQTPEALEAILRELCQKYDAVCRRVDSEFLVPGFFRKFIDIIHQNVLEKQRQP